MEKSPLVHERDRKGSIEIIQEDFTEALRKIKAAVSFAIKCELKEQGLQTVWECYDMGK